MESPLDLDRSIRFAIANRRLLQFTYNSKPRVAEPHDYGLQNGGARLLVYQTRGESQTLVRGWKLLEVSRIEGLVILEDTFRGGRVEPGQRHMSWDELFSRVEPRDGRSFVFSSPRTSRPQSSTATARPPRPKR
jgi:hypothetical protein